MVPSAQACGNELGGLGPDAAPTASCQLPSHPPLIAPAPFPSPPRTEEVESLTARVASLEKTSQELDTDLRNLREEHQQVGWCRWVPGVSGLHAPTTRVAVIGRQNALGGTHGGSSSNL